MGLEICFLCKLSATYFTRVAVLQLVWAMNPSMNLQILGGFEPFLTNVTSIIFPFLMDERMPLHVFRRIEFLAFLALGQLVIAYQVFTPVLFDLVRLGEGSAAVRPVTSVARLLGTSSNM